MEDITVKIEEGKISSIIKNLKNLTNKKEVFNANIDYQSLHIDPSSPSGYFFIQSMVKYADMRMKEARERDRAAKINLLSDLIVELNPELIMQPGQIRDLILMNVEPVKTR